MFFISLRETNPLVRGGHRRLTRRVIRQRSAGQGRRPGLRLWCRLNHGARPLYFAAIRTSLSVSVILNPGCSRKNRTSDAGSVDEYVPLT